MPGESFQAKLHVEAGVVLAQPTQLVLHREAGRHAKECVQRYSKCKAEGHAC